MSTRKRAPKAATQTAIPPLSGVVGTRPGVLEEARERWRAEGRKVLEADVDAKIDQVRADARALETAAQLLERVPSVDLPIANMRQVTACMASIAAGMRLAADRMPDSREIPF